MKKALLLQYRNDVSAEHEMSCILSKSGLQKQELVTINTLDSDIDISTTDLEQEFFCIFLGGSGQFDISQNPSILMSGIEKSRYLLEYAFEVDFPVFGICMGHQILSYLLGGTIGADSIMSENGTIEVTVNSVAQKDPIFKEFPDKALAICGHKDSVVSTPPNKDYKILASTKSCPVEAFRYKQNIYGVQFHPELGPDDVVYRWSLYPTYIASKTSEELAEMKTTLKHTPYAALLLKNFVCYYNK